MTSQDHRATTVELHQRKAFPIAEILTTVGLLHLAAYIIYATAKAGLL